MRRNSIFRSSYPGELLHGEGDNELCRFQLTMDLGLSRLFLILNHKIILRTKLWILLVKPVSRYRNSLGVVGDSPSSVDQLHTSGHFE